MTPIRETASKILDADRRRQAASAAGDNAAWEAAVSEIDRIESTMLDLPHHDLLDAIILQTILVGRLRRLRQDGEGGIEHEAELMAAQVLDILLDATGVHADRPRDLIQYAYGWGPPDHADPGP